jgi:serine/threonine protein kinase
MTTNAALSSGQVLASQFRIVQKLGQGGMGSVWLAEQLDMGRKVVVKVLNPELTQTQGTAVERFRREAQAVARLNHPNIVQIFVFGTTEDGQLFIAMEFVEGRDLGLLIAEGPTPEPRALRIIDQACSALIEAHSAGIVHRDLKPENIVLTDRHGNPDYVKVLDFGIAKLHDTGDAPSLTQAGTIFGTPRYMAPEQVKGHGVDARADIYALALILHELLTGHHPFSAATAIEYLVQHVNEPVRPLSETAPDLGLSPRTSAIVARGLEKDPTDRFQSVADLQREVRAALRDFSEAARGFPTSSEGSPPAAPRRQPVSNAARSTFPWVAVASGAAVLGLGLAAFALLRDPPSAAPAVTSGVPAATSPAAPAASAVAPPAVAEAPPLPAPEEDRGPLRPGAPIDGFPVPAGARPFMSSPQAEMYEVFADPADVLRFYRAELRGRYALQPIPNGVSISDPASPFTAVVLAQSADGYYLTLPRNALAPASRKAAELAADEDLFGTVAPAGSARFMRQDTTVMLRSRLPLTEVCRHFIERHRGAGVDTFENGGDTPMCQLSRDEPPPGEWSAISVLPDPQSAGAVMISITRHPSQAVPVDEPALAPPLELPEGEGSP